MEIGSMSGRRIAVVGLGLGVGALVLTGCHLGTPAVTIQPVDGRGDLIDPTGMVTGDIDGDADVDLIAVDDFDTSVLVNDGSGAFTPGPPAFGGGSRPSLADVDGDDDLDLLLAVPNFEFGQQRVPALRRNDGTGVFGDYEVLETTEPLGTLTGLVTGDADGDGDVDLFAALRTDGSGEAVSTYLNDGTGTFGGPTTSPLGFPEGPNFPVNLVAGDLDADGDDDVVATAVGIVDNGDITFERTFAQAAVNDGAGVFTAGAPINTDATGFIFPLNPALGDLDADGDLDLALGGSNGVTTLLGDGAGGLAAPVRTPVADARTVEFVRPADIDGDGHVDLVGFAQVDSPSKGVVVYGDSTGGFEQVLKVGTGVTGTIGRDVEVADVDGDGDADVLYAGERTLGLLENVNGGR
jgi:hypothetical protein